MSLSKSIQCAVVGLWLTLLSVNPASAHTRVGVNNAKGAEIIPCRYQNISWNNGFYLAREFDPDNVMKPSPSCKLFDRDGKLVTVPVPEGFLLWDIYFPEGEDTKNGHSLPEKTLVKAILKDSRRNTFFLNDKLISGKTLFTLPPHVLNFEWEPSSKSKLILGRIKPRDGTADGSKWDLACFDEKGMLVWEGTREELAKHRFKPGSALSGEFSRLTMQYGQMDPDRIIKVERDEEFQPRDWKDEGHTGGHISRREMFHQLLEEYNLIGMSRKQIETLLGPPDRKNFYWLVTGFCGNGCSSVEVCYNEDGCLQGWRIYYMGIGPDEGWNYSNVVWTGNWKERYLPRPSKPKDKKSDKH